MTIHRSTLPSVPLYNRSIFTHLFYGRGNEDAIIYTDAPSGISLTLRRVKALTLALAFGTRHHTGLAQKLRRGDTICIYSPNSMLAPLVLLGCARRFLSLEIGTILTTEYCTGVAAGLRVTSANPAYTARELAFQYSDSRAKLIFTTKEGLATVRAMFKESGSSEEGRIVLLDEDESLAWASGNPKGAVAKPLGLVHFEDLIGLGSLEMEEKFEGEQANETCILCYSSGTTGKPKVCRLL